MNKMKANLKKVIKNRFYIIEDLGQGGYGSVHKAIDKITNEMVAIKFVRNHMIIL
jgi:serine/threonine protein kinase